jgi:putative endonuclease
VLYSRLMSGRLLRTALRWLDRFAEKLPWTRSGQQPAHLRVGSRGEDEAYFWLRRHNYTIVARNWRSPRRHGEIDLIGWNEGVLCFIEVKTRSRHNLIPAEAAVDADKQHELRAVAREYLRRLPGNPGYRFDVVSVYCETPQLTLLKNAFPVLRHDKN